MCAELGHRGARGDSPPAIATLKDASAHGVVAAPGSRVEVRLLGPVEVLRDGRPVRIGAAKQRMALALLALHSGEVVSSDRLVDALWGERPPPTAGKALHVYVSELRKLVELDRARPAVVITQAPGYRLALPRENVDLGRLERLWEAGRDALADGRPDDASRSLAVALQLWRGQPLADCMYEAAFEADVLRLEEMRVALTEDRIDADLALGRHAVLIPELERLIRAYPLRERPRGQLMLALYRSRRQADALAAYQHAREALVEQLGIDPSRSLSDLERRILQQDASLDLPDRPAPTPRSGPGTGGPADTRTVMVVSMASADVDGLLSVAVPLARDSYELVLARVIMQLPGHDRSSRVAEVTRRLAGRRDDLRGHGVDARVAAFASPTPAADLVKLVAHQDASVVVIDGTPALAEGRSGVIDELVARAPCDVALHIPRDDEPSGAAVLVPFAGGEHDWAALELAALISRTTGAPLVLAGAESRDPDQPDASRALAAASLVLQRTAGVVAEPRMIPPGPAGVTAAAADARLVVVGFSPDYRERGLGPTRSEIARNAPAPALFVRRGGRPGPLAPQKSVTRFAWSLAGARA
jgi:DNA-binding SARP family transcriptional activator